MHDASNLILHARTFEEYLQVFVEIGRVTTDNARVADALLTTLEAVAARVTEQEHERVLKLVTIANAIVTPAIQDARTDLDRTQLAAHFSRFEQSIHPQIEILSRKEWTDLKEQNEATVQSPEM
jgi:uncharacterized membrane protein